MGKFTKDVKPKQIKEREAFARNTYQGKSADLLINGKSINKEDYSQKLNAIVKASSQYDGMLDLYNDKKHTLNMLNEMIYLMNNKGEKADKVTIEQKKEIEKELPKLEKTLGQLRNRVQVARTDIQKYKSEDISDLEFGVHADDKVTLQLSNDRFFDYLSFIEINNMDLTLKKGENVDQVMRDYTGNLIESMAADFDKIFPQLVGTSQLKKCTDYLINPLRLIVINGKPLAEQVFIDENDSNNISAGFRAPLTKNGKKVDPVPLYNDELYSAIMKAAVMGALVNGDADIRFIRIESIGKRNFEVDYKLGQAWPLKVNLDIPSDVENCWIAANKKNFLKKRAYSSCAKNRDKILDPAIVDKYLKKDAEYRKLKGEEKEKYKNSIETKLQKEREAANDDKVKKVTENLQKEISRQWSSEALQKEAARRKEAAQKNLQNLEEGKEYYYKNKKKDNFLEDNLYNSVKYELHDMKDDDKYLLTGLVSKEKSYQKMANPDLYVEELADSILKEYEDAKESAAYDLKMLGLNVTGSLLYLRAQELTNKNNTHVNNMKAKRKKFEEEISDFLASEKNNDKKVLAISAFGLKNYLDDCMKIIGDMAKMIDEIDEVQVGSYYTLDGQMASSEYSSAYSPELEQHPSPEFLGEELRKEYFAAQNYLKDTVSRAKKIVGDLYGCCIDKVVDYRQGENRKNIDLNLKQLENLLNIEEFAKNQKQYADLTGMMLAAQNNTIYARELYSSLKNDYIQSQNRLQYTYLCMEQVKNKILDEMMDENSPVHKKYMAEKEVLDRIAKKNPIELTEEEALLKKNNILYHFDRLEDRMTEHENLGLGMNKLSGNQRAGFENFYKEISRREKGIPEYHDKALFENMADFEKKRQADQQEKPAENQADDKELDQYVNHMLNVNEQRLGREMQEKDSLKKAVDRVLKDRIRDLSPETQANLYIEFSHNFYSKLPMGVQKQGIDGLSRIYQESDLDNVIEEYSKRNEKILAEKKEKRNNLSYEVASRKNDILRTLNEIEIQKEENEYYLKMYSPCAEMIDLAKNIGSLQQAYARTQAIVVNEENQTASMSYPYFSVLSSADEMTDILQGNNREFLRTRISDLMKQSSELDELDPMSLSEAETDNEKKEREDFLRNYQESKTFFFGSSLATEEGISGKTDKYTKLLKKAGLNAKRPSTLAQYDELSIEAFMELYQEARALYDNDKDTFVKENPAMDARFNAIMKLMGTLEETASKRTALRDYLRKEYDARSEKLAAARKDFKDASDSLNRDYAKIADLVKKYDDAHNDPPYGTDVEAADHSSNPLDFANKAQDILNDLSEKIVNGNTKNRELNEQKANKQSELDKLTGKLAEENKLLDEEKNLQMLRELKKNFTEIQRSLLVSLMENLNSKKEGLSSEERSQRAKGFVKNLDFLYKNYNEGIVKNKSHEVNVKRNYMKFMSAGNDNKNAKIKHDFENAVGFLYAIHDMGSEGHDDLTDGEFQLYMKQRELAVESYKKAAGLMLNNEPMKKYKKELAYDMDVEALAIFQKENLALSLDFLSENTKSLAMKTECAKGKLEPLYKIVFKEVKQYTDDYNSVLKNLLICDFDNVKNIGAVEKSIVEIAGLKNSDNPMVVAAQNIVELELKYQKMGKDVSILRDVITKKPRYPQSDVKLITDICKTAVTGEIQWMIGRLEEPVMEHKKELEKDGLIPELKENRKAIKPAEHQPVM